MHALIMLSRAIDFVNARLGRVANWMILIACLISAANAMIRYAFDMSSNAWLEVQWYLFAGVVMLARRTRSSVTSTCASTFCTCTCPSGARSGST